MATYTKVYNNPYPDGWKDGKDGNTPVTADILNNQTETLEAIEQYLEDNPIEQGGGSGTGGTKNYEELENKPKINGVELVGDLSAEDLGLTGGGETGTTNYEDLTNKPSINGTELSGDITLDIPTKTSDLTNDSGFLTDIKGKSYNDLAEKPQINGIDLQGNLNVEELGLLDITESTDTTLENSKDGVLKIKEIYGNTKQDTTSGKNLLDSSGLTEQTINGVTFTPVYDDKGLLQYINVNGTATEDATYRMNYIDLIANTEYAINGCPSGGSSTTYFFAVDGNIAKEFDIGSGNTFTFESDTNTITIIKVRANVTVSNFKFYPMIRLASITDGTYEPFTNGPSPNPSYPQEIKSVVLSEIKTYRKNLLDCSGLVEKTINGVTFTPVYDDEGLLEYINVNGTATAISIFDVKKAVFSSGQYILNGCPSGGSDTTYRMDCYYSGPSNNDIGNGVTFEAEEGNVLTTRIVIWGNVTVKNLKFYPMIRLATITDGTYEPYTESVATLSNPITLNGLNGVQDYVDVKRGVEHHKFKTVVLDGNENWSSISLANGLFRTDVHNLQNAFGTDKYQPIICSHYPVIFSAEKVCCFLSKTEEKISFISNHVSTLDEWKEWLSSNNVTVVYELAEPIETPLTDADVEALKSLKTYDGVTHIFTDSEIEPDWFVEYNTTRVGTELDEIDAELAKINKRITDIGTTAQMNYSTEEQVVGTWIDGKPLYRKVINYGALPNKASQGKEHGISDIEEIWIVGGWCKNANNGFVTQLNLPVPNGLENSFYFGVDTSIIRCETGTDRTNYSAYVIVQYTKTTDTV